MMLVSWLFQSYVSARIAKRLSLFGGNCVLLCRCIFVFYFSQFGVGLADLSIEVADENFHCSHVWGLLAGLLELGVAAIWFRGGLLRLWICFFTDSSSIEYVNYNTIPSNIEFIIILKSSPKSFLKYRNKIFSHPTLPTIFPSFLMKI